MGAYLCIASNDVPPAVSKRIYLHVQCKGRRKKKLIFVDMSVNGGGGGIIYVPK